MHQAPCCHHVQTPSTRWVCAHRGRFGEEGARTVLQRCAARRRRCRGRSPTPERRTPATGGGGGRAYLERVSVVRPADLVGAVRADPAEARGVREGGICAREAPQRVTKHTTAPARAAPAWARPGHAARLTGAVLPSQPCCTRRRARRRAAPARRGRHGLVLAAVGPGHGRSAPALHQPRPRGFPGPRSPPALR